MSKILDDDIIFIRKQSDADDGDMVVVLIDNVLTLKRLYKNKEIEGIILLTDENHKHSPIVTSFNDINIIGKIIFKSECLKYVANV